MQTLNSKLKKEKKKKEDILIPSTGLRLPAAATEGPKITLTSNQI